MLDNILANAQADTNLFTAIVSVLANIATIAASGIAIYLFIAKRKAIASVFKVLINYSAQLTLTDLKVKLERLNDLTVNDEEQKKEIIYIMHDIIGQIQGNKALSKQCVLILAKIKRTASEKQITEQRKRSVVSELRETIRHLNVTNFNDLIGAEDE